MNHFFEVKIIFINNSQFGYWPKFGLEINSTIFDNNLKEYKTVEIVWKSVNQSLLKVVFFSRAS